MVEVFVVVRIVCPDDVSVGADVIMVVVGVPVGDMVGDSVAKLGTNKIPYGRCKYLGDWTSTTSPLVDSLSSSVSFS